MCLSISDGIFITQVPNSLASTAPRCTSLFRSPLLQRPSRSSDQDNAIARPGYVFLIVTIYLPARICASLRADRAISYKSLRSNAKLLLIHSFHHKNIKLTKKTLDIL